MAIQYSSQLEKRYIRGVKINLSLFATEKVSSWRLFACTCKTQPRLSVLILTLFNVGFSLPTTLLFVSSFFFVSFSLLRCTKFFFGSYVCDDCARDKQELSTRNIDLFL